MARVQANARWAGTFSDLTGSWTDDEFTFALSVQGIAVRGTVRVLDRALHVDCQLPVIAAPFSRWLPRLFQMALRERPVNASADAREAPLPAEAGAAAEAGIPPVVLFLHIPKAGGTTLGEFVYNQCCADDGTDEGLFNAGVLFLPFGFVKEGDLAVPEYIRPLLRRPDLRAVVGHFWFGIHEHVTRPWTYVTLLRHPVERVVSLYHFLELQGEMSLEEFAAAPPIKEVDNDQTRRIAGVDPDVGRCTAATLRAAQANLREHFSVVGVTERFDETLMLMRRRLGWTKDVLSYPRNVNAGRPATASVPPAAVDAIRERNRLDFELYDYVTRLMDDAIAAEGPEFERELERYRDAWTRAIGPAPAPAGG